MSFIKYLWNNTCNIQKFSYFNPLWLFNLHTTGFTIIKNVKPTKRNFKKISFYLGSIQNSPYGKIWDTAGKIGFKTTDKAYQKCSLEPHTDMNYIDNNPKFQIWIPEIISENGGETILVDGLTVKYAFKTIFPIDYKILKIKKFKFICSENKNISYKTIFSDHKIHYNKSDIVHNNYPSVILLDDFTKLPEYQLKFKLKENEALIINNHRILHGRTAFTGERNLIGCYIS